MVHRFRLSLLCDKQGRPVFWDERGLPWDPSDCVLDMLNFIELVTVMVAFPAMTATVTARVLRMGLTPAVLFDELWLSPCWPRVASTLWCTQEFFGIRPVADLLDTTPVLAYCSNVLAVKLGPRPSFEESELRTIVARLGHLEIKRVRIVVTCGRLATNAAAQAMLARIAAAVLAVGALDKMPQLDMNNQSQARFETLWNAVRAWYIGAVSYSAGMERVRMCMTCPEGMARG